jgi:hypothetical protein
MAWQCLCRALRNAVYPLQWMGLMLLMCFGMKVENGDVRSAGEEDESTGFKGGGLETNW